MMHYKSICKEDRWSQKLERARDKWGLTLVLWLTFLWWKFSTSFLPTILKSRGVDKDPNSKSELDSDESNDTDHEHDEADQEDINPVGDASLSASFPFDIALHLHYSEGVDTTTNFNSTHRGGMEKLNVWNIL